MNTLCSANWLRASFHCTLYMYSSVYTSSSTQQLSKEMAICLKSSQVYARSSIIRTSSTSSIRSKVYSTKVRVTPSMQWGILIYQNSKRLSNTRKSKTLQWTSSTQSDLLTLTTIFQENSSFYRSYLTSGTLPTITSSSFSVRRRRCFR